MDKRIKSFYQREIAIWSKVREQNRICSYPDCTKSAINSHILQENGVLDVIANKDKLFMEQTNWGAFRDGGFYPVSIRKSKTFTFKGFCNEHDTAVFDEIERGEIDLSLRRHQLLFSYRGMLLDLYSAITEIDFANRALHDPNLPNQWNNDYIIRRNRAQLKWNELSHHKWLVEDELFKGVTEKKFMFHSFVLPKIEVAASTISGGVVLERVKGYQDLDYLALKKIKCDNDEYTPLTQPIFINLIPRIDSLVFILGHVRDAENVESLAVSDIEGASVDMVLDFLSRILPKIERWSISVALFDNWKEDGRIDHLINTRNKWIANANKMFHSEAELAWLEMQNDLPAFSLKD